MADWTWAASGILAALLTLGALAAVFDEQANGCITSPAFVALLYLTCWIWSHVI